MKLLLLPGNSPINKEWAEELKKRFEDDFDVEILSYQHWETGKKLIDFDYELSRLMEMIPNEDYVILAKSAGILLTLMAMSQHKICPRLTLCLGLPLGWARLIGFKTVDFLSDENCRLVIVQHTNDPAASAKKVRKFLTSHNRKDELIEWPGDTHNYDELDEIAALLKDLV